MDNETIIVRNAEMKDTERIVMLLNQIKPENKPPPFDIHKAENVMSDMLKDSSYRLKVCEADGKIVGTATLFIQKNVTHGYRPYGHIENVVTDSAYRGAGIGKRIMESLIADAKAMDCYKVILDCNENISSFYEKVGFRRTKSIEMRLDIA